MPNVKSQKDDLIEMTEKLNSWMGNRLLQLRLSAGFSQNQFARDMKISRMTVINIENGKTTITNRYIYNSSKIFGVPIIEFFPAEDKDGNYITQAEYKELVKNDPISYPKQPKLKIMSLADIETNHNNKLNDRLTAISEKAKSNRTRTVKLA